MNINRRDIEEIINQEGQEKGAVIPVLQAIQDKYQYLPEEALKLVNELSDITPAQITGVASFYSQFRLKPVGDHIIKVCIGTACHVKGAELVYDSIKRELNIGIEDDTDSSKKFTVEKVACLGCCTIAPVVQIDNVTYGHVSPEKSGSIIKDFNSISHEGRKEVYKDSYGDEIDGEIRIGLGSCCVASGSEDVKDELEKSIRNTDQNINIKHVGCVGMCHQVPLVEIVKEGEEPVLYSKVSKDEIDQIINNHFQHSNVFTRIKNKFKSKLENLQFDKPEEDLNKHLLDVREKHVSSFLDGQVPVSTEYRGIVNPLDIEEYQSLGGFKSLEKSFKMNPEDIINEVINSNIRGRGGAGFPSGKKWAIVAKEKSDTKYIICNGDEGDPGAFMDRMILESYPYRVIEGMIIAAYATNISNGIFYIRAEYPLAVLRIQKAIENCYSMNILGNNIMDSGFSFDIKIHKGAGAFVCGEETALITSIEGNRGFPKLRPPYPAVKGLWGKPTLVNNTETLSQLPYIINNGAEKFKRIGTESSKGTKVFSLAGKVARGGLIEIPMGMTIRQIVENIGGGAEGDHTFKAVQIGGPSGGCIPHWLADTPVDFESLTEIGAMMGSGSLIVLDESDCMVDIAKYFLSFTQNESCGKCTFCRIGTKRMLDILERITEGHGKEQDLVELEELSHSVKKGSLCGLGKTAPNPVLSTLKYFRDEYEAHINGKCPTGKCKSLIKYTVNDNCIGCTICSQKCPVEAIPFYPHNKHEIIQDLCIKCDTCKQVCPENAITIL